MNSGKVLTKDLISLLETDSNGVANLIFRVKEKGYVKILDQKLGRIAYRIFSLTQEHFDSLTLAQDVPESNKENKILVKRIKEQGYIYLIKSLDKYKIGWTEKSPEDRLKALQTGNPETLALLYSIKGSQKAERVLHKKFNHLHYRAEWFKESNEIINFFESDDFKFLIEHLSA